MKHEEDQDLTQKEVEENLRKQFKNMVSKDKAPKGLKEDVFHTLDSLNLFADFIDLFTVKFSETELIFLDALQTDEDKENPEN